MNKYTVIVRYPASVDLNTSVHVFHVTARSAKQALSKVQQTAVVTYRLSADRGKEFTCVVVFRGHLHNLFKDD